MKSLSLLTLSLCIVSPIAGWASSCMPYNNVNYALQANGANGTLTKSQGCTNGTYSISSQINVSKAFFSKQINQAASGTYASPNTIDAQSFTSSNNSAAFPTSDLDPLSLVLYLSNSLSANITKFPTIPLFYNGNTISVQCVVSNPNASVTTSSGVAVAATQVICSTADNSIVLGYSFSQDKVAMMLAATSMENGKQTISSVIDNYPQINNG